MTSHSIMFESCFQPAGLFGSDPNQIFCFASCFSRDRSRQVKHRLSYRSLVSHKRAGIRKSFPSLRKELACSPADNWLNSSSVGGRKGGGCSTISPISVCIQKSLSFVFHAAFFFLFQKKKVKFIIALKSEGGKKNHWGKHRVHLEILGGEKEQSGGRTVGTALLYNESSEVHALIKATVLYNSAQLFYSIRICSHFHPIVSLLYFTLSYTRQSTQLRNRGLDAPHPPFYYNLFHCFTALLLSYILPLLYWLISSQLHLFVICTLSNVVIMSCSPCVSWVRPQHDIHSVLMSYDFYSIPLTSYSILLILLLQTFTI